MIDAAELALAQSYEQLEAMPSFRNLLNWLDEGVGILEMQAATASDSDSDRDFRARFTAWQQRKVVVLSIRAKMEDAKEYVKEAREIAENERAVESDRTNRANW